jgi:hypothetical protein
MPDPDRVEGVRAHNAVYTRDNLRPADPGLGSDA